MAWDTTMITMLRALIGDFDKTAFSDTRLKQVLIVAAQFVNTDVDFDTSYIINVVTPSITPDPTSISDNDFINFVVLKSACIIDRGAARTAALRDGIEARCGPAVLRTAGHTGGWALLLTQGYCKTYEDAVYEWALGNGTYIRAVMSPFVNGGFDPEEYGETELEPREIG